MPQEKLMIRAQEQGLEKDSIPMIDYYHETGELSTIKETFDLVMSSHVLEHQPDLVTHLNKVEKLLTSDGKYAFIVPDSRYCFDHFIYPSNLVSVVKEFQLKRVKPDLWNVIEHRALTCHNDPKLHWNKQSGDVIPGLKERWSAAEREFLVSGGTYIDVHCWQFTPESLKMVIEGLFELDLINFTIEEIYQTPQDNLEFCVVIKKATHTRS
jgi:hypothetical protein